MMFLKVFSRDFFFLHNKFTFGMYIHVYYVVLIFLTLKCSQITKIMFLLQEKLGHEFTC